MSFKLELDQENLNPKNIRLFSNINKKNKIKFNNFIQDLYKKNSNPLRMLTPIFSRDNHVTNIYSDLNFLCLVDYLIKKKKIKIIYVSNFFLKKIIKQKYKHVEVKLKIKNFLLKFAQDFFKIVFSLLKLLIYSFIMLFSKNSLRKKKFINKKINLIETFFSKNLINKNIFLERYNKDVFLNLPENLKKTSYFFPVNLSIFCIRKFLDIKEHKIKFIHPLDFLNINDYLDSIFFIYKLGRINSKNTYFNDYKIDIIIQYHNILSYFNFSSYLSRLNYIFLKKLKKNNVKINFILDWYENQIIDKGLSLGKNTFFPNTKMKGHMGFINDIYNIHHYNPTKLEKKLNVLPDEILLIGKKIHNIYLKRSDFLKFKLVPALRNQKIFKYKKNFFKAKKIKKSVLIILSADQNETNFIYKLLKETLNDKVFDDYTFLVKLHSQTFLTNKMKNFKKLLITNKNIYDLFLESDIVISGGTTATIESFIFNKKIILIGNNNGIVLNPILEKKKHIKICFSPDDLKKSIIELSRYNNKEIVNIKLMNSYFNKFNKKLFKNFYN